MIIDNNGPISQVYLQLAQLLNDKGDRKMQRVLGQEEDTQKKIEYVFGLDIGTRNVVGTVGYKEDKEFIVVAQYAMEHETRAMLDGQIHDIGRVGRTISVIKEKLEDQIGQELTEVCIAAAGRVLKTVTTFAEYEFPEETVVTGEHIHTLELLGVDKAAQELKEENDTKYKFYCVGYSVMKYYINDEIFSNIESHKADKISAKIIVTFLPEDVVDGLYMAVGFAGLTVANMTLEPIAAIDVAIPENFRMLNIALVDVGAGTSDISLTRDGSIIAYGMIPFAGDELTEMIVQHYLVDFKMAEHIKLSAATDDEIEFEDIMSLKHTITAEEVWKLTEPLVDRMSTDVAEKIKELNGDQSVSATFIVGGGGKIHGFDEMLAKKLELPQERVALRGAEVLKEVTFLQDEIVKDPLLVTPIGICLNYYEQKNNFIMVRFNGERLKLYDNNKLTIVDAAIQAGFPNDQLFPKRGREINFTVNGRPRIVRGEAGEAAIIRMNDRPASINTPIEPNCDISIEPSTAGREARYMVGQLEEYHSSTITFEVNGKLITCPRYVEVNGVLEPPTYEIKENDAIVTRSFYTVEQLAEFMDVELDMDADILVNNRVEDLQALVYENFSVDWKVISYRSTPQDVYPDAPPKRVPDLEAKKRMKKSEGQSAILSLPQLQVSQAALREIPAQTKDMFGKAFTDLSGTSDAQGKASVSAAQTDMQRKSQDAADVNAAGGQKTSEQQAAAASRSLAGAVQAASVTGNQAEAGQAASVTGNQVEAGQAASVTGDSAGTVQAAKVPGSLAGTERAASASVNQGSASQGNGSSSQTEPSAENKDSVMQPAVSENGNRALGSSAAEGESGQPPVSGNQNSADASEGRMVQAASVAGSQGSIGSSERGTAQPAAVSENQGGTDLPESRISQPAAVSGNQGSVMQQTSDGSGAVQPAVSGNFAGAVQGSEISGNKAGMTQAAGIESDRQQALNQTGSSQQAESENSANAAQGLGMSEGRPEAVQTMTASGNKDTAEASQARAEDLNHSSAGFTEKQASAAAVQTAAGSAESESVSGQAVSGQPFQVVINGETVTLKNKKEYIFVDIFEHITFDLSQSKGRMLKTEVNGIDAQYTQLLHPGDKINIYWKES